MSIFFETDNIEEMHARLSARGGRPGQIEKVNWIKMRMFEVRDPDGHVLWFGESYNGSARERPEPMLEKALPFLPLDDVEMGCERRQRCVRPSDPASVLASVLLLFIAGFAAGAVPVARAIRLDPASTLRQE